MFLFFLQSHLGVSADVGEIHKLRRRHPPLLVLGSRRKQDCPLVHQAGLSRMVSLIFYVFSGQLGHAIGKLFNVIRQCLVLSSK